MQPVDTMGTKIPVFKLGFGPNKKTEKKRFKEEFFKALGLFKVPKHGFEGFEPFDDGKNQKSINILGLYLKVIRINTMFILRII